MKTSNEKKSGAPKKWKYDGVKKNTTIRLTKEEKESILELFPSVQAFVQEGLDRLK